MAIFNSKLLVITRGYPSITLESGLLGYAGIAPHSLGPSPSVVSTARDPPGAGHPPISDFEGANGPRKYSKTVSFERLDYIQPC